jgi:K(+)-stimulated pyrophosphate-energized sodium pump
MKSTIQKIFSAIARRGATLLLSLFSASAFAAGAEANVKLVFTNQDKIYLYISLGLALIAILFGFGIRSWVLRQSPGTEKMQEVGAAIRDGALAYLRQQVRTMSIFVLLIAGGLAAMYWNTYAGLSVVGIPVAIWIAIAFILGVIASYLAGYIGMIMAVAANMRVASAAQTSYKGALEVAFKAGSVAGLVTVGMGLLGATLIFLLAGEHAMKMLIGFGFGGSLAALFMRVGGGIFTKAADVGADLVGKVEAGIPEDDPRNAATIADNVGDNVGDCAGMAADVFESYEVTLVAAIVLGAATAAIFDQSTWMKLILFALMARGVGIIASIIGIYLVKGKDDEKLDPLKPISQGFWISAGVAVVATAVLAWFMMGNVNAISWVKQDGEKVSGVTPINMADLRWMHVINEVEAGIETPNAPPPATKPELSDAQFVERANKYMADLYAQHNRNLPANAPKEEAPERITEPQVDALRENPLRHYAMIQMGQAGGKLAQLAAAPKNNILMVKVEQVFKDAQGKPQGEPVERWMPIMESGLATLPDGWTVKEKVNAPFGIDEEGDLFWTVQYEPKVDAETIDKVAAARTKLRSGAAQQDPTPAAIAKEAKVSEADAKAAVEALSIYESIPSMGYTKKAPETANPMMQQAVKEDGTLVGALSTTKKVEWWRFALAIAFGIAMAFIIERLTDYFVSFEKKPVREIAMASTAGPAPMIIQGFAYAMESAVWSVLTIVLALLGPIFIFPPEEFGGYILSFYGIALVGLGLLTTTAYILAMDTFGPISDNAQGVYEMSGAKETETKVEGSMAGSRAVQRLDAAGNTTKALTKGFAIATAVVAAVALFHSFIEDALLTQAGLRIEIPEIFIGLLIGGAAPFLFSAFSINAVGRASFQLIGEVRRQFAADPGIMAGTSKPDYARCVAIVTSAAQKELLGPGILAIAFPILVGFGLAIGKENVLIGGVEVNLVGAQALGGFLAGAILSGQLLAVTLANSGGAWDNSKKLIEDGMYGGKGSEAHKAGVVVDTVGDPFKDTAGPALNPLIKVMNLVALLLAPMIILPMADWIRYVIVGVTLVALAIAVFWSKRGSMGAELAKTSGEG